MIILFEIITLSTIPFRRGPIRASTSISLMSSSVRFVDLPFRFLPSFIAQENKYINLYKRFL
ncbi:hypothetical cytosolic protein [Syntrophus aciditrophicus SB]|uniref:Hypothetical cytosolic protein n=1 Tax=Syntrophus aciditrophicus (strain SB) TaxID=56780 RepID=Q2LS14_SYNAS|nr:hypothetical cytosolic protein [Syntrophus aciditrophicus SB]